MSSVQENVSKGFAMFIEFLYFHWIKKENHVFGICMDVGEIEPLQMLIGND